MVMRGLPAGSVNLIVTSPPYSDQRKDTYGGIAPEKYVEWFLNISAEMQRLLTPDGSLVLNIKEKTTNKQRDLYVHRLILALCDRQGWKFIDEFIWHKKNGFPNGRLNGLRDGFERCLHFAKQTDIKIRKENVRIPIAKGTRDRANRDKYGNRARPSKTGSGMNIRVEFYKGKDTVFPSNVLHTAAETQNRGHPAVFPVAIPDFFIRLLTDPGDTVLDPFFGSGTTGVAAHERNRHWIGIERNREYYEVALARTNEVMAQPRLEGVA